MGIKVGCKEDLSGKVAIVTGASESTRRGDQPPGWAARCP